LAGKSSVGRCLWGCLVQVAATCFFIVIFSRCLSWRRPTVPRPWVAVCIQSKEAEVS